LWAWEEELVAECRTLLSNVVLQPNVPYQWRWLPNTEGGYLVRTGYQLLTSQDSIYAGSTDDLIWHNQVPLKVSILAWRLPRDRLPTKSNLLNHDIISSEAALCTSACGQAETASHLFLHCTTFGSLWRLVQSWLGVT